MKPLGIGEVSKRAGVGVETVRYYERQGLLRPPERKSSGYRIYTEETVQVLRFIRRAKELGFTLREIKKLLELRGNSSLPRTEVKEQARQKVVEIDSKINDLKRMRSGLQSLVDQCHGSGSVDGCPILLALQGTDSNQAKS